MTIKTYVRVEFKGVVCISGYVMYSLASFFRLFLVLLSLLEECSHFKDLYRDSLQRNKEAHNTAHLPLSLVYGSQWPVSLSTFFSIHKALFFTPLIKALKATYLINSLTLNISSLKLFKYASVDLSSNPKEFREAFFSWDAYTKLCH